MGTGDGYWVSSVLAIMESWRGETQDVIIRGKYGMEL